MHHLEFTKIPEECGLDFPFWECLTLPEDDLNILTGGDYRDCLWSIIEMLHKPSLGCDDSFYVWLINLTEEQMEDMIEKAGYTHNLKEILCLESR